MKKYRDDLKLKVVKDYQEGHLGIRPLAKKYRVSKSVVGRWIQLYEKWGANGLVKKNRKQTYSTPFKMEVLHFIKKTGSSAMEAALQFGIKNPTIIASWKKDFQDGGAGGAV